MAETEVIIDQYSFLNDREASGDIPGLTTYSWVPKTDQRRLQAYKMLYAYKKNLARLYREESDTPFFEDGDVEWLCRVLTAAAVGGGIGFNIETKEDSEQDKAQELETALKGWMNDEMFSLKCYENEEKCSNLGDCVYLLRWNKAAQRTRLTTYDPGFVFLFPDITIENPNPRAVIAWEEADPENEEERRVYKREYTLIPKSEGSSEVSCFETSGWYKLDDEKSLNDLERIGIEEDADGPIESRDLGIDFLPLIWIKNLPEEGSDYGNSDPGFVLDLIDKINNTGSDLDNNSKITGFAMISENNSDPWSRMPMPESAASTTGEGFAKKKGGHYRTAAPGMILQNSEFMNNSHANDALMKYADHLDDKLLRLTQIGQVIGGKIKAGEVPSGYALRILISGLEWQINAKHLVRVPKYSLLFNFVQRMYLANAQKGPWSYEGKITASIKSGIPEDVNGRQKHARDIGQSLSTETRVRLLKESGVNIDDAAEEAKRIKAEEQQAVDGYFNRVSSEA